MGNNLNIAGLDPADVIDALYQSMKFVAPTFTGAVKKKLSDEMKDMIRQQIDIQGSMSFDYIFGKSIKVTIRGDELFDVRLYDRDHQNGEGACEKIIAELRKVNHEQQI
jgi:hypothetical protein